MEKEIPDNIQFIKRSDKKNDLTALARQTDDLTYNNTTQ